MKANRMVRRFLNEFSDGDAVDEVFLLADKQLRANRNASLYLSADLRDRTGLMNARMWNVQEESLSHINAGDFVKVRGKVHLFQGALQMILTHIHPVSSNSLELADFVPQSDQNIDYLLERLREILLSIDDADLRTLMECFLVDEEVMEAFSQAPAGIKAHHAYHGGLLEHVVTILEVAHRIADLYPKMDMNLLTAGVFLHDLGKVRELSFKNGFAYTDEGQLLGHLVIAVDMLNEKVAQASEMMGRPFPQDKVLRLKHMILSHHGTYEFGSPKLPMTPEAIALHHLDNLDAKVHEFTRSIEDDPNAGTNWTPYSPRLQRKLFKGQPNGEN